MAPDPHSSGPCDKQEGRYANFFEIGYNAYEFVFDFSQSYHENDEAELCTRIVTNPFYAKSLLTTLNESIRQYEQRFGPIKDEQ